MVESKILISVWFGLGCTTKFESTGEVRRESRILRVRVLVSVVERSDITEDQKILQTRTDLLCPRGSRKSITRERIYLCYSMGKKNQNRAVPHVWKPYKYARGKLPLLGISPIGIDIATLPPPLLFKTTEMQEQW